jgi:hypothetical protein
VNDVDCFSFWQDWVGCLKAKPERFGSTGCHKGNRVIEMRYQPKGNSYTNEKKGNEGGRVSVEVRKGMENRKWRTENWMNAPIPPNPPSVKEAMMAREESG